MRGLDHRMPCWKPALSPVICIFRPGLFHGYFIGHVLKPVADIEAARQSEAGADVADDLERAVEVAIATGGIRTVI